MQSISVPKNQQSQALKTIYFICIIVSVVVSWGILSQFLFSGDASVSSFFQQSFASPVSTLISSDILITAPIFLIFARVELSRLGMPANRLLLYTIATFSVGICCSLSLFLYQREVWQQSVKETRR